MNTIILKTKKGFNGKGGLVGSLCLIQCNTCKKKKWISGSKVKNGGGKFCSRQCYAKDQKLRIGERHNNWKGGLENKRRITREWIKNNKERFYFLLRHRNYLKKNAIGSHTHKEWEGLKKVFNYMCVCCFKKEPEITLTEDHIIPLSKGGNNYIANIQPLCKSCNSIKNNKTIKYIEKFL